MIYKYSMVRIIGNELPPRDLPGNRLKSLDFVLKNEFLPQSCERIWIINQIHCKFLRKKVKEILERENCHELSFDLKAYRNAKTRDEKIISAININKARNLALKVSKGDFTFVFDGDCYFDKFLWNQTVSEIELDQKKFPDRKYYGVLAVRSVGGPPKNMFSMKKYEPSLVFRKDAELKWNESIPFSKAEKIELLMKLGYPKQNLKPGGNLEPIGDMCKNVGGLIKIKFNDEISETNLETRMRLRDEGLDRIIQKLDCVGFL